GPLRLDPRIAYLPLGPAALLSSWSSDASIALLRRFRLDTSTLPESGRPVSPGTMRSAPRAAPAGQWFPSVQSFAARPQSALTVRRQNPYSARASTWPVMGQWRALLRRPQIS